MISRAPKSLEENIVAELAKMNGCVSTEAQAVIPPPDSCPAYIKMAYSASKIHLFTAVIMLVFVVILFQLVFVAKNS